MILWVDGTHDAAENMRRDAHLLEAAENGAEPVMRLFGFSPPGITLGLNQDPGRELDLARCAADRVCWALRPTGGRAIFHAEEWTYALAAPMADPAWGGSQTAAYERVSGLLVASLRRLGIPASLARRRRRVPADGPRGASAPATPCFASAARHEVVLDGRKLIGSAQRRTRGALLQQGSLLLGDGHLRLADYLPLPAYRRVSVRDALGRATRNAGRWLGADAPLDRWAEALMSELPAGSGRLDGATGAFLLTVRNRASYTTWLS